MSGRNLQSLTQLLAGYGVPVPPEVEVTGVAVDSRRVSPGDLFLACRGRGTHGLAHLDQALQRGAVAVAWEPAPGWAPPQTEIPEVAVPHLAERVGEIASRCLGEPSRQLYCVGITGTDGKTSTAYLLAQALDRLNLPCAYVGTLGFGRIGELDQATHTTPDAVTLQSQLARALASGARSCAMEVSSHALDQKRVSGVAFDVAVLTNVTRDHLDYHGTVEHYAAAKRQLFARPELEVAVLNRDDACGARWADELNVPVMHYGLGGELPKHGTYVLGDALELDPAGLRLQLRTSWGEAELRSRLLGRFNAYNLMAVLGVLLSRKVALADALAAIEQLRTVPGRIEGIRGAAGPLVVVDYAHTPEALGQILRALRAHAPQRLLCVFGCGGDRDRGKRPLMGAVAAELADRIIVTDDNPRSEDPAQIAAQIVAGIDAAQRERVATVHDRADAIRRAVAAADAGDIVVIAGKGHEQTQTYGAEVRSFSDRHFVAELLGTELTA
ncbi:UDP-N-acetylmuramoyl-L-alanyl-D-glutamate--2,6-diaminopimelate ligase [Sinimarinibacterium sp. CAU 1509]|uniref:UDP-N-acetylmuramoyl-L-alanyl-D-glutamate--2, 6-diaminopimelate ligase n=1 Tax=Sinimarinibacterium sp. CAU 1509 TaxID=2562283 RepID=UPI0010AC7897|nr:UDP-N-acetylmuramoyl-L-alanyl-D-glutamate--2,6-diaminopimelate ligase [Sinimarinibacterium sp. CAU 1509]TJY65157.1 UDP-N-acetylmuramoyl-L-alanyl-D-glutamate--2,6-diaminopimelate ligase [Sinimarinibacterium sp. CAU 1509]